MRPLRRSAPLLFVAGLLGVLAGERLLGSLGGWRWLASGSGLALVLVAVFVRAHEWRATPGPARRAIVVALAGYSAAFVGLAVLYPLTTPAALDALGLVGETRVTWRAVLSVAWVLVLLSGSLVALFADGSRARSVRPEQVEVRRVRAAGAGGLSLALAIGWFGALNYSAEQRDVLWEWGLSTAARPSPATAELVGGIQGEPVEVTLFFAPSSDVLVSLRPYFDALAGLSDRVRVRFLDHTVEPTLAKELGALANGAIFIVRGKNKRRIQIGTTPSGAHRRVAELDRYVQEAILKVARERQELYRTVGHDEREVAAKPEDGRSGIGQLTRVLGQMNVSAKGLGLQEGLGGALPSDAGVVFVIGPKAPFLPEEVAALRGWLRNGGSLLLALDPGSDHGLGALLRDDLGLTLSDAMVANSRFHAQRAGGLADRIILVSNRFGTHPAVASLARASHEALLVLDGAAALSFEAGAGRDIKALVRPMAASWLDGDGDRAKDGGETEEIQALAAAVTLHPDKESSGAVEGRAIVIGDSDLLSDAVMRYPANARFLVDAYLWLARESDAKLRVAEADEDPPLLHTREASQAWFWLTVAGVPLAVLGAGLFFVRRRQRGAGGAP